MADYRVHLDIFAGPLDLLLYLVRKEEVDIYDIPIAKITDQYVQYAEMLKQLDIDLAGDFLVMAATLMEIKSAMLLPRAEPEQVTETDGQDPRAELVRQLLEYKKFKDAANLLHAAVDTHQERFNRPDSILHRLAPETQSDVDMEHISVWDLLDAFDAICRATGHIRNLANIKDDTPIDLYQIEILHRLQTEGNLTFRRLFEGRPNRLAMVGQFLALLELIRGKLVWVEQSPDGPDLFLRPLTQEPAEQAVQRAILAVGEDFEQDDQAAAEAPQATRSTTPPIPIVELPAASSSKKHAENDQLETLHAGRSPASDPPTTSGPDYA